MCDIAPMGMKCENDEFKYELTCCAVCHLAQAWNNLWRSIPIVGNWIKEYHCSWFEPHTRGVE